MIQIFNSFIPSIVDDNTMPEVMIAENTSACLEMDDGGGGGGGDDEKNNKRPVTRLLSRSLSKVSNVTYDTKKNMAQGMMDIALLTANANQLRYILEFRGESSTNFVLLLVLIACSLILQVWTIILSDIIMIGGGRVQAQVKMILGPNNFSLRDRFYNI